MSVGTPLSRRKRQRSCLASCCRSFCCCGARKAITGAPVAPADDSDEEAKEDAKAFVKSVKAFIGIGDDDPDEVCLGLLRRGACPLVCAATEGGGKGAVVHRAI